ncbi:hypothetical protein P170DRAFT_149180 [Aspergillus steynii IBT 23096]|uniref:Secreted protein n=1 Tax=Aspergillus steynii IBT 23096 TaxID=1392250 RepID=A0A2I2GCG6_9EURO|nr:uncharacterized protein P170DRAFT_149180 [Aspergillus steynii IBT 23096]PLB50574.1 hypothetical protein P170DRAFT_149180 [Aspergillus steynii IBT 23096]
MRPSSSPLASLFLSCLFMQVLSIAIWFLPSLPRSASNALLPSFNPLLVPPPKRMKMHVCMPNTMPQGKQRIMAYASPGNRLARLPCAASFPPLPPGLLESAKSLFASNCSCRAARFVAVWL